MKVAFRVDSGERIGAGHLMRCRTLGDSLVANGHECLFICRNHPGHLGADLEAREFRACLLNSDRVEIAGNYASDDYASWLGTTEVADAEDCSTLFAEFAPDWIVVDHYSLSQRWEQAAKPYCGRLMVIDDLANRVHDCDLLLDQTFGRKLQEYNALVPDSCNLLCGAEYAMLRPEFRQWRATSLGRARDTGLQHILVSMGGVDSNNVTAKVLTALERSNLSTDCRISAVLGRGAPWRENVVQIARASPLGIEVREAVSDMAKLMSECDLAIGAAGSTAWERCCLGLPTIMTSLAENQSRIAEELAAVGAAWLVDVDKLGSELPQLIAKIARKPQTLASLSDVSSGVTDGRGVERVFAHLTELAGP